VVGCVVGGLERRRYKSASAEAAISARAPATQGHGFPGDPEGPGACPSAVLSVGVGPCGDVTADSAGDGCADVLPPGVTGGDVGVSSGADVGVSGGDVGVSGVVVVEVGGLPAVGG
jgi:hypothetical protein